MKKRPQPENGWKPDTVTSKDIPLNHAHELRLRAEALARKETPSTESLDNLTSEEIEKTLHELRVHQIQLEMQNEELRRTQTELDLTRARYFDLYDLAPVGYVTLSDTGIILEANLTAATLLGAPRGMLTQQPFSRFIHSEDLETYRPLCNQDINNLTPHMSPLRMVKEDGTIFWGILSFTRTQQSDGLPVCRIALNDITEHKQVANALLESEQRYRTLFDSASDAFFLVDAKTGQIIDANRRATEIYGYTRDELLDKKCIDLSGEPELTTQLIHETHAHPDRVFHVPLRLHRRKDRTLFPVEVTSRSQLLQRQQPILIAIRDITERMQAAKTLQESELKRSLMQAQANAQLREQAENLTSIYEAMDSIGLIVCDLEKEDCRIKLFNPGAEKLFGYSQDEAVGKSIKLIYPPELLHLMPQRAEQLRQGKPLHSFDMPLMRKSGERFPAVISVHPFDCREGRFRKTVGVFRDISQQVRAEQELMAMNEDLERRVEQRTRELQETQKQYLHAEKLSAIGKLSASIAHEFNNPLQGILSILKGLLKRAILEAEDRELLEAAIGESERIKELIRSLQDFNRPTSGRKTLMDVHQSLNSILLLHKSDFKRKQITVELDYAKGVPQIMAIPDQIKQVILNLLTNAADACQQAGGMITISTRQEGDSVAIAITDTGIGIEPQHQDRIFQPFFTTKAAVKGTGLGLSVCHGIVKKHQGEIWVESRPGQGTTFTVLLPINPASEDVPAGTA
jgi:PAS domain S-box-containing protein